MTHNPSAPEVRKYKPMPQTITMQRRTKDADKVHSVIFSTENSPKADRDIVDSIYFKRPFADGVKELKITVVRDLDAVVDSM